MRAGRAGRGADGGGRVRWTLLVLVLSACGTTKSPEVTPPAAKPSLSYFAGTPFSGPLPHAAEVPAEKADALTISLFALRAIPDDALELASARADGIYLRGGDDPVLATGRLTRGARYGAGAGVAREFGERLRAGEFGPWAEIAVLRGLVLGGVTSDAGLDAPAARHVPGELEAVTDSVKIQLCPGEATGPGRPALDFAVGLSRVVAPVDASAEWLDFVLGEDLRRTWSEEGEPYYLSETLHFRLEPEAGGEGAAIVLPSPFDGGAIAAVVEVRPIAGDDGSAEDGGSADGGSADGEPHEEGLRYVREEVARRAERARDRALPLAATDLLRLGIDTVRPVIDEPPGSRKAVIYVSRLTGAAVAEGLGTVVSQSVLDEFEANLKKDEGELAGARTKEDVGWWLERAAIRTALDAIVRGDSERELTSVLLLRAGQVGADPSALQEAMDGCPGLEEFETRLVHENLIHLEDSEASARVRAYDWLAARDRAPKGYDPLGPRKERRQALLGIFGGEEAGR